MEQNTNWQKSVGAVIIKDGKVLLGRHTYGNGNGKLILPGGYLQDGELPEEAMIREVLEETGVTAKPIRLLGVRFNEKDWYVLFLAEYINGDAMPCDEENSEVLWIDTDEAVSRQDVPQLSKLAIKSAVSGNGIAETEFSSGSLYIEL